MTLVYEIAQSSVTRTFFECVAMISGVCIGAVILALIALLVNDIWEYVHGR